MGKPKAKIYTDRDWEDAVGLDRLYMHLMEPERWTITLPEVIKLEGLRKTWRIICKKSRTIERIRCIQESFECTERTAYRYIKEASSLFLDTLDIDHELELRLAYDRYLLIYEKAKTDSDWDSARRAQDSAMKIREQLEAREPKKAKAYATLIFTDNPLALTSLVEDIDHEELDDDETRNILELEAIRVPAGDQAL